MEHHKNLSLELLEETIEGVHYIEEFRPVAGFEGIYEVSSFGRIKRLRKPYRSRENKGRVHADRIMPSCFGAKKKRYLKIHLRKDMKSKSFYIHRLVALHFIDLVLGKDHVNHKTGDKFKNHYAQLEWCTPQENNEHGFQTGLLKRGRTTINKYIKKGYSVGNKKVVNIKTGETYAHVTEASEKTGISIKTFRRILTGERYNHTDYRYVGQEHICKIMPEQVLKKKINVPLAKFNEAGECIEKYEDIENIDIGTRRKVTAFLNGHISSVNGFYYKKIDSSGTFVEPPKFISKRKPYEKKANPIIGQKAVMQYDKTDNLVALYASITEAAKAMGAKDRKQLQKLLNGKGNKTYKGFIWKFA